MKKVCFLLILSFLLLACANMAYEQKLRQWVGQYEQTLIESWGRPTVKKVNAAGQTLLTYVTQNEYLVPTEYFYDYPGWDSGEMMYDPFFADEGMPPYAQIVDTEVEGICQTTFVVQDGVITAYRFSGNDCQ